MMLRAWILVSLLGVAFCEGGEKLLNSTAGEEVEGRSIDFDGPLLHGAYETPFYEPAAGSYDPHVAEYESVHGPHSESGTHNFGAVEEDSVHGKNVTEVEDGSEQSGFGFPDYGYGVPQSYPLPNLYAQNHLYRPQIYGSPAQLPYVPPFSLPQSHGRYPQSYALQSYPASHSYGSWQTQGHRQPPVHDVPRHPAENAEKIETGESVNPYKSVDSYFKPTYSHDFDSYVSPNHYVSSGFSPRLYGSPKQYGSQRYYGSPRNYGSYGSPRHYGSYGSPRHYGSYGSPRHYGSYGSPRHYGSYGSPRHYGSYGSPRHYGSYGSQRHYGSYGSPRHYGSYGSQRHYGSPKQYGSYRSRRQYGSPSQYGSYGSPSQYGS